MARFADLAAAPIIISKINYLNFDEAMTSKYGIRVRNWPLTDFKCPGKINSLPALQILYNAFKNDVTTFYKMSPTELEAWRNERYRPVPVPVPYSPLASNNPNPIPISTPAASPTSDAALIPAQPEVTTPVQLTPIGNSACSHPAIGEKGIYSAVFAVNGQQLVMKKPRKQRSDKGKKRGNNVRTTGS
jgi:hypothetical protein